MGMFRDASETEIDIVKEMAEGLGSTGLRLEDLLDKATQARERAQDLIVCYGNGSSESERPDVALVNDSIREYNALIDKAEDALRWLLIQREACGFRTHRNVRVHYPIPTKIRLLGG
ncbi:MAG: hypothetical protein RDU20_13030 [Desulfomonilaceae bacterium]|nr:hypothetical protein [Desulfomonilaceae bacterium]